MNKFCEGGWKAILDAATAANVMKRIRLFKNDHTPVSGDTVGAYTEADFDGYPGFTALTWAAAFVNATPAGETDATNIVWTKSAGATGNTIYGVYITDGSNVLTYAERFAAPILMTSTGAAIDYTPKVTDLNQ